MTHLAESTSTNQSQDKQKKHVEAWLNFFKDNEDGSPPAPWIIEKDDTFYRPHAVHRVTISDVRGEESDFTLDENGFQIHAHTASDCNFLDDDEIKASYYPEVQQLLKELLVYVHVLVCDKGIRLNRVSTAQMLPGFLYLIIPFDGSSLAPLKRLTLEVCHCSECMSINQLEHRSHEYHITFPAMQKNFSKVASRSLMSGGQLKQFNAIR